MPLIDFNTIQSERELKIALGEQSFDYTVIGCGAVGIHLGLLLTERGKSVLVLESGRIGEQPEKQALNQVDANRSDIKSSLEWGRKRALGGTTIRWGGQALPFSPLDFSSRPWLNSPGWPIDFDSLRPYYRQAERYMGIREHGYYGPALRDLGLTPPFSSASLDYHISKWAPEPNMFKRHRKRLLKSAFVLFNAHTTHIESDGSRCLSLTVENFNGLRCRLHVQNLIIAAGAAETTRLLMTNALSNSPALGKGFMEHPCMDLGTIQTNDMESLQIHFSTHMVKGFKYGPRMSLTDRVQIDKELTNVSASLMFETAEGDFDPLNNLRSLTGGQKVDAFKKIVGNFGHYLKSVVLFLKNGVVWKPYAKVRITAMCEQLSSDGSTLELDFDSPDDFGIPKLKVHWAISDSTWKSACETAQLVKAHLQEHFDVHVELRPEIEKKLDFDARIFSSVNHHMGGTVMGVDPGASVVNSNLRLHEVENIWVCSASVFPTGSHSNPTLTALALAGRFVGHVTHMSNAMLS